MALEMCGGFHRALSGPTVSSNMSSSGNEASLFAKGVLKSSLGPISAL